MLLFGVLLFVVMCTGIVFFFFKQKTAYEILALLEFRRVLFRSFRIAFRPSPFSNATWKSFPNFTGSVLVRSGLLRAGATQGGEMQKDKVLFICVHNSARSQMAAALLNNKCGEFFEAHSAGLEPGAINPLAVEALRELGIDISNNRTQRVFDVL